MIRYVCLPFIFLLTSSALAVEYRVPVDDPQFFDTDAEIKRVVVELSESLTGLSQSILEATASDLFALSEVLVNSYGFSNNEFIVDLDEEGLRTRLESAGIEIWKGERPEFLVWATEERGLERVMIGIEPNAVVDQLLANGIRFGIPMRRPLMDLEDTMALSAAEIWGEFEGAVEHASNRYSASQIIVIGDRPQRSTLRYWLINHNGQMISGEVSGVTSHERVEQFTTLLLRHARSLEEPDGPTTRSELGDVSLPKLETGSGVWIMKIQYDDIIKVMELVDYLDTNDFLSIEEMLVGKETVELQIGTELTLEQTDRIMTRFKKLRFVAPLAYSLN